MCTQNFECWSYVIDPYFIKFYQKKNFEILTNFTQTRFLRPTRKIL